MKTKFFILITLTLVIASCKNDLNINAPYKDLAVIYCFLDQNEPIQYIRIEKMYQNSINSNTHDGAQIADSLYFDSLVVKIINISTKDTFNCYKVDSIPKDNGFFSSAKNTLYATKLPYNNDANEVYQLYIYYPKNNKTYTAQTYLVKDASIEFRKVAIKTFPTNHAFSFTFTTGRNSSLYDLIIRYSYKEMDKMDTTISKVVNLDYYVARGKSYDQNVTKTEIIYSKDYLEFLTTNVKEDNTKIRRTIGITYIAYGGSKEFAELVDLSKPNLSIVEKNPSYSNISPAGSALGIFSSRNFRQLYMGIDPNTLNLLATTLPNFIN